MLSPDETAVETVLGHPFLVRSRRFVAQGCMRFKSTLNATRSAGGSGFLCGFLALLARVRANSFQMKRVFVGGIIMGRAPKDMKHPELRGNDTVLRDALLVKINCWQDPPNRCHSSQKKRTTEGFFASMRKIANSHQQAPGIFDSYTHSAGNTSASYRMASDKELSDFLQSVERRAFKQAAFAVRRDEAAFDIVQDAMIKLAEKYGDKPAAELPMLFQRILQNTIHDFFRREKVRNTWVTLFSGLRGNGDDSDQYDVLETFEAEEGSVAAESSEDKVSRDQVLNAIDAEVQKLPGRQREAFLLRYWQDMDVAETAAIMGCSEGSVKTHCSRATHTLAHALKSRGIRL